MKIINQRNDTDCVIACMAMMVNESYDDVLKKAIEIDCQPTERGMDDRKEWELGKAFGMHLIRLPYYGGLRGIMCMPSLNFPRKCHAVFVDDSKFYDPQSARDGKRFYRVDEEKILGYFPSYYDINVDMLDEYSAEKVQDHIDWFKSEQKKVKGIK